MSTANTSTAANPGSANTPSTTGNTSTGNTPAPTGGGLPADIVINQQNFTSDSAWPAELMLDRLLSNWVEWDRRLNLVVDQQHFSEYLDGSLPCPDASVHPKAARNWKSNNRALRAFILEHVSNFDYGLASVHINAHDVYEALWQKSRILGTTRSSSNHKTSS
jgi:hypothetical protein